MTNIKTPEEMAKKDFVLIKSWASDFICRIVYGSGGDVTDHFLNLASNELTDKIQFFKLAELKSKLGCDHLDAPYRKLLEENKRLREALEEISKCDTDVYVSDLAKQALGGKQ